MVIIIKTCSFFLAAAGMDAWSQWNAQRATAAAAATAPGFQASAAYPAAAAAAAAAAAGGLAAQVPSAAAVPASPAAPVGGYPMGYPYYGQTMPSVSIQSKIYHVFMLKLSLY